MYSYQFFGMSYYLPSSLLQHIVKKREMKKNWIADKDFVWKNSIEIVNNVKCVTSLPWSSRYCLSSILWFCRFCCYCWEDIFFILFFIKHTSSCTCPFVPPSSSFYVQELCSSFSLIDENNLKKFFKFCEQWLPCLCC